MTRKMKHMSIVGVVVVSLIALRASTLMAVASTCRPTDSDALVLRSYIRELVSSTALERIQVRNSLGLKAMDSTRVNLVTDNRVCDKVGAGINIYLRTPDLPRSIYVVSVGTDYAAQDPGNPAGQWWPTITLDNKYKAKGAVLAP